jgi:glycosyltransferase involved in cell wall biosynthesis
MFHPALAPYRIDLFNFLNRNFEAYFFFELSNAREQEFDQVFLKTKVHFFCHPLKSVQLFGRTLSLDVLSQIVRIKPQIIVCSEYGPIPILTIFFVKLFYPKTRVYTLCDDSVANAVQRKGLRRFLRNRLTRLFTGTIVTSPEVADWYRSYLGKDMTIIDMPIVHDDGPFQDSLRNAIPKANENMATLGLQDKKIILFVGRLATEKNIDFLIKAYARCKQKNTVLIIVGDGKLRTGLENLVIGLGLEDHILFMGHCEREKLLSWYVCADLFVLPSIHEPFGAVVNEALIAGCRVLCSNLAGASTLIHKDNGVLFSPYDLHGFSTLLQSELIALENTRCSITELAPNKMPFTFKEKSKALAQFLIETGHS